MWGILRVEESVVATRECCCLQRGCIDRRRGVPYRGGVVEGATAAAVVLRGVGQRRPVASARYMG